MNRIYKVIWSKVKNCYIVVSEIAKSHSKPISTKLNSGKTVAAVLAALALVSVSGVALVQAVDVKLGDNAGTSNYVGQVGSIAIGNNSYVENMGGTQESLFSFGQTDQTQWAAGISIGQNAYARTGSVMLGDHKYVGALGDTTVEGTGYNNVKSKNVNIFSTTVGANSYNQGAFSTVNGAYSIISGRYNGGRLTAGYASQNFGAVVTGALNSIESATTTNRYSGIANSIVGTANRTFNSNGALVFGAGNEITNSTTTISAPSSGGASAKELQTNLMTSIRASQSGGATLAIGGGNKADYTQKTSIIGVNNTVTGKSSDISQYNNVTGFNNTATNVDNATVIGTNRTLSDLSDTIVIGSADSTIATTASNAVAIGSNSNVTVDGGVALGSDSVASVDKGVAGTVPTGATVSDTDKASATWTSTLGAVSVGVPGTNVAATQTRQITGVAAGTQATDAVNVAQLNAVNTRLTNTVDANKIHFFHVNSTSGTNYDNDGAKGTDSIAIGKSSTAADNSIAIGNGASVSDSNGGKGSGDIAIGNGAKINNYVDQSASIAIGQNAQIDNMTGMQEMLFAMGQTDYNFIIKPNGGYGFVPADPSKVATAIAIGENTFVRTGGLMIGTHNYRGALGDVDVDSANIRATGVNVNSTTLGTNSYNSGAFATIVGAYSIASGNYASGGGEDNASKNLGATIVGSLNSVESSTAASTQSGMANSVVGVANRTFNSNGSLIFGAGNEITNSVANIASMEATKFTSAKAIQTELIKGIKAANSGGSTLAIGGGNTADYTLGSALIGVNNTLKGTESDISQYNAVTGFNNTATGVSNVTVTGTNNNVTDSTAIVNLGNENAVSESNNTILLGDNRTVTGSDNSIILGRANKEAATTFRAAADTTLTTTADNVVVMGYNANATVDDGVALGSNSVASVTSGVAGYDPTTKVASTDTTPTWKSTLGAVSVGVPGDNAAATQTRQITGVAAGMQATDAVNVAQLTAVNTKVDKNTTSITNLETTVNANKTKYYSVDDYEGRLASLGNADNSGAQGIASLAAGIGSKVEEKAGFQGATATVVGALNTVAAGTQMFDGVANSIVGVANATQNANATLIFGAGNAVTNSYGDVALNPSDINPADPVGTARKLGAAVGESGGQVLVIGGANSVDYARFSAVTGVSNTLNGASGNTSDYNFITGAKNTLTNTDSTYVIGSSNTVSDGISNVVIGDKRKLIGATNDVVIGAADNEMETKVSDATILGHNANSTVANGVALGSNSVASVDKGVDGYNPSTKELTGTAWTSTVGSVSVGDAANNITRQITGVAAGTADTDAVNVAQLKANKVTLEKGDNVTITADVDDDGSTTYTIASTDTDTTLARGTVTYVGADGTLVLTDSAGNDVEVTGLKNIYLTAATLSGNTLTLTQNEGAPITVEGIATTADLAANKVKYFSVKSELAANQNNDGAKGTNSIAIGPNAKAEHENGIALGTNVLSGGKGSIVIGSDARVAQNITLDGSIVIGKGAEAFTGGGEQEALLGMDPTNWPKRGSGGYDNPTDASRVATSIVIGTNASGRTGSIDIGDRVYKGTMGGREITDKNSSFHVNQTTLGTNSYNKGLFSTMVGSYSIATGSYDGGGRSNTWAYGAQNFGATVMGSLNSIRSNGSGSAWNPSYQGIANTIVGLGNITDNSNGSLVFGAGNKITNSITSITMPTSGADSVDAMVDKLQDTIKKSNSGGATLAIGGGNTADYTRASSIIGVNNTLKGTSSNISQYNALTGYNNMATNVDNVTVTGSNNTVTDTATAVVIGDNRTLTGVNNNVVIGSADSALETTVSDAVAVGRNANVTIEGGAALGANSVARTDKGVVGYDPSGRITDADSILGSNTQYQSLQTEVADAQTTIATLNSEAAVLQGYMDQVKQIDPNGYEQQDAYQAFKAQYDAKQTEITAAQADLDSKQSSLAEAGKALYTWQSTAGSVSVGDVSKGITRQITDVAAGTADTDAVNVAQLKANKVTVAAGDNVTVTPTTADDGSTTYTVASTDTNTVLESGKIAYNDKGTDGTITLTDSANNKVNVEGVKNTYLTEASLSGNTLTLTQNEGDPIKVTGIATTTDLASNKTHYYSVNDGNYQAANYDNKGAKGGMSLAAGAGSTANGTASTVTGAFSRIDGDGTNGMTGGFQGATAAAYGSFNVVGAKSGVAFDGVANSIIGVANKTENANAALIMGAGNKVTNSYRPVDMSTVDPLADALQTAIATGNTDDMITALGGMVQTSGGAVLAIGGANTVDYALLSKVVGVGNTLTGTEGNESKLNMIDGFANTGTNVNNVTVIGSGNTVADTNSSIVLGDNRKLTGASNSVFLGAADKEMETTVADATAIGHNANVTVANGVALGSGSVASVDKDVAGYDVTTGKASAQTTATWKSTAAAVSVGDVSNNVTRQITGVAAGMQDTDAVNVAQLKQVAAAAEDAGNTKLNFAGDDKTAISRGNGDTLNIIGGATATDADGNSLLTDNNIGVVKDSDSALKVQLAKNLTGLNSVAVGDDVTLGTTGLTITNGPSVTTTGINAGNQKITNVVAGTADTDAVNVSQLNASKVTLKEGSNVTITPVTEADKSTTYTIASKDTYVTDVALKDHTLTITQNAGNPFVVNNIATMDDITSVSGKHTAITLNKEAPTAGANGALGEYVGTGNLTMAVKEVDGQKVYDLKMSNNLVAGTPGKDGKNGEAGSVTIIGEPGSAGADGKNASANITVKDGSNGLNGKDGLTRIVYVDEDKTPHEVATLDDGLNFTGDTEGVTVSKKLNETLSITGGADTTKLSDNNIGVVAEEKGGLTVKLAKDLTGIDSARIGGTVTDGVASGGIYIANQTGLKTTTGKDEDDGLYITGLTNKTWNPTENGYVSGRAATEDQLQSAISQVTTEVGGKHTAITLDGTAPTDDGNYIGSSNLTMAVKDVNGQKVYDLKMSKDLVAGTPGKDGADGQPGTPGTPGSITIIGEPGKDGADGTNTSANITVKDGKNGLDGTDGITRIVYKDEGGTDHEIATMDDGLNFTGDTAGVTVSKKLNETLSITGGITKADQLTTEDNIGVVASDSGLKVRLAKDLQDLNSVRIGGTTANGEGIYIANQTGVKTTTGKDEDDGLYITGLSNTKWNPKENGYVSGRAATEDQLNSVYETINKNIESSKVTSGKNITVDENNKVNLNDNITLGGDTAANQVNINGNDAKVTAGDGANKVVVDGSKGQVTIGDAANGGIVMGNQTDVVGTKSDGAKDSQNGQFITGLDNTTWDPANKGIVEDRAATEGQLKDIADKISDIDTAVKSTSRVFESDSGADAQVTRKSTDPMKLKGGADANNLSDNNIGVVNNSDKTGFDIKLSKDIKGLNSIEVNNKITIGTGDNQTIIEGDTINTGSVTTGNTTINNDGLTIVNEDSSKNITINNNNVNMGGNVIKNIGEGSEPTDAINKGQFDRAINNLGTGMNQINNRVNKLDNRVNRVGAGAAALAALHPLEFSPDAKWEVTAGVGNYRGANAIALGAFYRPNFDTMFSIGTSYGGGENMINAGVTWRIGEGETKAYPSKTVMAQEIDDLKTVVSEQQDQIEELKKLVNSLINK